MVKNYKNIGGVREKFTVYLFHSSGESFKTFRDIDLCSQFLDIPVANVRAAITKKRLLQEKYFVSRQEYWNLIDNKIF